MTRYSPEINAAIGMVCRAPATKIATLIPSINIQKVGDCIQKLLGFLSANIGLIGQRQYILGIAIENTQDTGDVLSAGLIVDYLRQGFNTIIINTDLYVVDLDNIEYPSASAISEYSDNKNHVFIHVVNGLDVILYAKGRTIKEMNARHPSLSPLTYKKYARHALDYKESLIDFYQKRIRFSQQSDHWSPPGNKSKRILCRSIAGKKTEMIFHSNLLNWLDEHLEGASVLGPVKKLSNDETDIEIRVYNGPYFILEIKWLGNNGRTPYSESRIRDGITQVRNYLERDPEVSEICLIVYDGRPLEKWKELECCYQEGEQWKEIKKCMTEELPSRGYGLVFFLENEDASKRK